LLDELNVICKDHLSKKVNDLGTEVGFIPGEYTRFLQLCGVGVNKPLKQIIMRSYMNW